MKHAGWMGAALVAGWLGCGGEIDPAPNATDAVGQGGASAGGGAAGGTAGAGLSGGSGPAGQAQAGSAQAGSAQAGSSSGGSAQAGSSSGGGAQAGSAGQGVEEKPGCDWYAQMLAKAKATSGPLHGLVRLKPDGSADKLPIKLVDPMFKPYETEDGAPPNGATWTSAWTIVGATDKYVLLVWTYDQHQALVAVSTTPGEPAIVIDTEVNQIPKVYQVGVPGEVPGVMYYTQEIPQEGTGGTWLRRLRRVDLTNPALSPETVVEVKGTLYADTVLLAGDELYLWHSWTITRVRKDKSPQELKTAGYALGQGSTGMALLGDRLVHTFYPGAGSTSLLKTVAITDAGMSEIETRNVSLTSTIRTVRDAAGQPAAGFLARGGLYTMRLELPIKFSLVFPSPTPKTWYFRTSHLEDGAVGGEPGYFVDVFCGSPDLFTPAFVTRTGELQLRASEPGFPFVQPLPWANTAEFGHWQQYGDANGIYAVLD